MSFYDPILLSDISGWDKVHPCTNIIHFKDFLQRISCIRILHFKDFLHFICIRILYFKGFLYFIWIRIIQSMGILQCIFIRLIQIKFLSLHSSPYEPFKKFPYNTFVSVLRCPLLHSYQVLVFRRRGGVTFGGCLPCQEPSPHSLS